MRSAEPNISALNLAADFEQIFRGSKFNVNIFEADEARRDETQNAMLREKQRRHEAQPRREAGE
jgi:hypothetical protein